MENCLPFTDDVMVVLVHKCVQQTHLLALHLETLGYIPRLLNALNGLVYFLIIGGPRRDNLMVGSISRKLLTELGIRTEDAECKLMAHINRRSQRHSKHMTEQKHKRSTKEVHSWNGQENILLEGLNRFNSAPTSPLIQMWIKTHRYLVCMKDP